MTRPESLKPSVDAVTLHLANFANANLEFKDESATAANLCSGIFSMQTLKDVMVKKSSQLKITKIVHAQGSE